VRLVLDTNVIVSGLITAQGPCARILDLTFEGAIEACVDDRLLAEYESVLRRPELRIAVADATLVLAFIRDNARRVVPSLLDVELPDRDDIPFIEVATAAEALLITGNVRHFPPRVRGTVTVVTPRELLDFFRKRR
jgi:uncharacterized protein